MEQEVKVGEGRERSGSSSSSSSDLSSSGSSSESPTTGNTTGGSGRNGAYLQESFVIFMTSLSQV